MLAEVESMWSSSSSGGSADLDGSLYVMSFSSLWKRVAKDSLNFSILRLVCSLLAESFSTFLSIGSMVSLLRFFSSSWRLRMSAFKRSSSSCCTFGSAVATVGLLVTALYVLGVIFLYGDAVVGGKFDHGR